jgi:glycosyltransferase involved in cell wall biosynthesis
MIEVTSGERVKSGGSASAVPRLRIVFCIDNMNIGGTELNAVRTAERLDRSRYDLSVVCLNSEGPLAERYAAAGVPVHPFPIPRLYGREALRQGMRLGNLLRTEKVDVFHAHDRYSNMFGVPWARVVGVPGIIASRRWGHEQLRRDHRIANRMAYRLAHVVLANSPRVGESLHRAEGVPTSKVAVVPNFLDEDAFTPLAAEVRAKLADEMGLPLGCPTIGIIANLRPVKDHSSLLRAVALLHPRWPELRVVLVGDGECRAELESLATDLGIRDRVCFAGRRPNQPNLHHLFDISVLCSLSEGLSNSVLEAMAARRPVVATDVGATADAVIDGTTGILVPPADPVRLSEALERLLSAPELARQMGTAGLHRAEEVYSARAALANVESLYRQLARSTG